MYRGTINQLIYDFPQSRAFMNSSSVNDSSLAASKCIWKKNKSYLIILVKHTVDCINRVQQRHLPFVFWECQSAWAVSWNPRWARLSVFSEFCFQQVDFLYSGVPRLSCPYLKEFEFERLKLVDVMQNPTFVWQLSSFIALCLSTFAAMSSTTGIYHLYSNKDYILSLL